MYGSEAPGNTWQFTFLHAPLGPPLSFVPVSPSSSLFSLGNGIVSPTPPSHHHGGGGGGGGGGHHRGPRPAPTPRGRRGRAPPAPSPTPSCKPSFSRGRAAARTLRS